MSSAMGYDNYAFESHLFVSFRNKHLLALLAETVKTGLVRVQICSYI
jgi:hypothetical protein